MTCFRATTEKRFVILDLETVWCHWCHVMEKTTYSDPKVIETAGFEISLRAANGKAKAGAHRA